MSASGDKGKAKKGKGKGLPKLKTILANPKKEKCPALGENELQELGTILKAAIQGSGLNPQNFATTTGVHIGLESSLRAINNHKFSCVLLSHTIQPIFLIRLIARNAEVKNAAAPVYVQTQLEDFTKDVFGLRTLALAFPTLDEMHNGSKLLGNGIIEWIRSCTKPTQPSFKRVIPKILKRKMLPNIKTAVEFKTAEAVISGNENPMQFRKVEKQWEGDFIALSGTRKLVKADPVEDQECLTAMLNKVVENVEQRMASDEVMDIATSCGMKNQVEKSPIKLTAQSAEKCVEMDSSDADDFLPEIYQPLTVHKIQANPNKKPKRKRPKKNNRNKK